MSFFHENESRQYFIVLCFFAVLPVLCSLLMTWGCAKMMQELLFEREQSMAASLLTQGIPKTQIAIALKNTEITKGSTELLRQAGHTKAAAWQLFPSIAHTASVFGAAVFAAAALFGAALLSVTWWFLQARERVYQDAAATIMLFAEGDFTKHLPQNRSGALFQMFAAAEELAVVLQAKNDNEKHTKEFLKNMIADISHQLKTPLSALQIYTEIIADEPEHLETVKRFSEKSMQSLERIHQLIQSLLKVIRLDAGSVSFVKQRCPVQKLVRHAVENLEIRAALEKKQILQQGSPTEEINCDPEWTGEALGNLIKNALDHTTDGGVILISWERSPAMLRLSVSDNGCGISSEDIHHIFKRFYRSKSSSSRQGVGLGLPLAKSIVEGQGGILSVSSTPGRGTVFTLSFLTDS